MVSRSKKPEAIKLWEFITETILPELFSKGSYTMPPNKSDIERLNKSFYDENMLSDWKNKNCVYLAYIGKINGNQHLKFGESTDFPRRELVEHRRDFKIFNVLGIWETLANKTVEKKLKTNFASKNMLATRKLKGNGNKILTRRELVILNEINNLDYCLNMIESVIKNTPSTLEIEHKDKINEWRPKCELLESKIESLKEINTQMNDKNEILKENNICARINYAFKCIINSQLRENIKQSFIFLQLLDKYYLSFLKMKSPCPKNMLCIFLGRLD